MERTRITEPLPELQQETVAETAVASIALEESTQQKQEPLPLALALPLEPLPKQPFYTRPSAYIILALVGVLLTISIIGSVLFVVPLFTQTATITLIPDQITRTETATLHVSGHVLPTVTQS